MDVELEKIINFWGKNKWDEEMKEEDKKEEWKLVLDINVWPRGQYGAWQQNTIIKTSNSKKYSKG